VSFSDRCAFVLVPLPPDLSPLPAVRLLLQNRGRLKKQNLITCGYKLMLCLRFHSSRLKSTQICFETSQEDNSYGQSSYYDRIAARDFFVQAE